ncbi:HipA family kinase [Acidicapsa acidisoli]|uniref:HipA family kinase n=1 Tax=Acidicapsa acidisoli TaxID=1615681 RepID=UPI0037BF74A0
MSTSLNSPLRAIQHIRPMGCRSDAHLMLCTDNSLYVVRFQTSVQEPKLISAFVGSRLARILGLPVPEAVTVEVSDFLINNTPELSHLKRSSSNRGTSLHPGAYYAGEADRKHLWDMLPDVYLRSLRNKDDFPRLLTLDKWCSHLGPPQAVFFRASRDTEYEVRFVNRSASFCRDELCFRDYPDNGVYGQKAVYSHVTGWDSLEPVLNRLVLISPDTLWRATRDLPFGWSVRYSSHLDSLVDTLLIRRSRVRELIAQSRECIPDLFPAWTSRTVLPPRTHWNLKPAFRPMQVRVNASSLP